MFQHGESVTLQCEPKVGNGKLHRQTGHVQKDYILQPHTSVLGTLWKYFREL
jgi:hypothetical protein